jgi:hypothetical protein
MFYRQQFNDRLLDAELLSSSLEDIHMRLTIKALVLTSAAVCATAAFAANQARVDVPFSFTAKGQTYPAGAYNVTLDSNGQTVTLQSRADSSKRIGWVVGPAEAASSPAVVKFDQIGTDYTLKTIQLSNHITPNLDTQRMGVAATTSIGGQ